MQERSYILYIRGLNPSDLARALLTGVSVHLTTLSDLSCSLLPGSVITFSAAAADAQRCAHYTGGTHVVTGGANKVARVWHARSGTLVRTLQGHAGSVQAVHVDEARGFLLTASYDTSIRRWSLRSGRCEAIFGGAHTRTVCCLAVDAGARLLASGGSDHVVALWTLTDPSPTPSPSGVPGSELSPEGVLCHGGFPQSVQDVASPLAQEHVSPSVPDIDPGFATQTADGSSLPPGVLGSGDTSGTRNLGSKSKGTRHRHTFVHDGRIRCVALHSFCPHPAQPRTCTMQSTGTLSLGVLFRVQPSCMVVTP